MAKEILDRRNGIYGITAIWIVLYHICIKGWIPYIPILSPVIQVGNGGVDVFLLLSGYCLCLSWKKNPDLKLFYKKRFIRILIPYLLISIPFFAIKHCIMQPDTENHLLNFILDISGYSFWRSHVLNVWFVHAILLFYIIFPIIYKYVSKGLVWSVSLFICIVILNYIACNKLHFVHQVSIASSRLPAFILGVVMACHKIQLKVSKKALLVSIIFMIVYSYTIQFNGFKPTTLLYNSYILIILPSIICMYYMVRPWSSNFFNWLGGMSLEIYLTHVLLLNIMTHYKLIDKIGYFLFPLVFIVSLTLSILVSNATDLIAKRINKKS